jgi:hypothetical protein
MTKKAFEIVTSLRPRIGNPKRWLLVVVVVFSLCFIPSRARAAGLGDIISLLNTITSTIQGAIGGALTDIQGLNSTINNFRQQIVWPLAAINQAKAFVTSVEAQYGSVMSGIITIKNNSASLVPSSQLESVFRSGQASSIDQVPPTYTNVYNAVPTQTQAQPLQRNMMDMDDALAMGSLKTSMLSDQTTQGMLAMADSIEQQSATTAPGSGPMLSTQAQVAELETQALMAKVLASELRAEAARLAHQNAWFKQSSASVQNLQNQMQRVLSQP